MFPLISFEGNRDLDSEKYLNFLAAVQRTSTINYFTVITVKDLNSGVIKEICTKGNFVRGAVHIELQEKYDVIGRKKVLDFLKSKQDRYFEFKDKKALRNISFFDYNPKEVSKIQDKYDFEKAVEIIKRDEQFSYELSDKEMKYFAHVLFNLGYMTAESDCFGGSLFFVDRTKHEY